MVSRIPLTFRLLGVGSHNHTFIINICICEKSVTGILGSTKLKVPSPDQIFMFWEGIFLTNFQTQTSQVLHEKFQSWEGVVFLAFEHKIASPKLALALQIGSHILCVWRLIKQ